MKVGILTSSHKICNDGVHTNHFDVEWDLTLFPETQAERDALAGNADGKATAHACVEVGSSHQQAETIGMDAAKQTILDNYGATVSNADFTWLS